MTMPVTRLTLLRHGATSATRRSAFPDDEPLEPAAVSSIREIAARMGRADAAWSGPAACALETASELGLAARVTSALADADAGAWRGRALEDIEVTDPEVLAAWASDPAVPPPGGESVMDVIARVGRWLSEHSSDGCRVMAVTHAVVIRAAVVIALSAPPAAVWRIDVAPLSRTVLHGRGGVWTVRGVNLGLLDSGAD
jgi:broad specificity phosphatase PhoE